MKTPITPKVNHGAYCRKSSESEDRQILSIISQIDEANGIARTLGVKIADEYFLTESKSAKIPNNRPEFKKMVDYIEKGKINGIIVWHADRLSRNPIDAAILVDLMDRGKLVEIVTFTQTFKNTPMDKFLFAFACMQAKMENDKKGLDIKRGMSKSASMGNLPTTAPIGYLNDKGLPKGQKHTSKDPERFDVVRKIWDLLLTGTISPFAILKLATDEGGLRTLKGKKLSKNGFYSMLRNSYYAGKYEYPKGSGNWHNGTYIPMITWEEFDRAQAILGKRGSPRPKSHIFEFTGMMRCGECGAMITAETKTKRQLNGNVHTYIFYHCTKRVNRECTQRSIEIKELKKQIAKEIDSVEIPAEFHSYAMKWFRSENEKEANSQKVITGTNQKAYNESVARLSNLIDMRASGELSADEFTKKQAEYLAEKETRKKNLDRDDSHIDQWNQTAGEMLTFIERAQERFKNGTLDTKRRILATLGSNLIVKDKMIILDIEKSLLPMKKVSLAAKAIKERLEPIDSVEKQREFERLCTQSSRMSAR